MIHPRADLMVARVARALEESTLSADEQRRLVELGRAVMSRRSARYADEHHPALLHPLRAVLLLLETGEPNPLAYAASLAVDSVAGELTGEPPRPVAEEFGPILAAETEERLEFLVTAPSWVLAAWLSLRLDHVRHLHMWAGAGRLETELASAAAVEGRLAARAGGRLERAWLDWLDKAQRFRIERRAEDWPPEEVRPR